MRVTEDTVGILWLRLYSDLPDHVRMRKLPEETQLFLVWYWCKWKTGDIVAGASAEDVAWTLRVDAERARRDMGALVEREYLDEDGTPTNWDDRQFASDGSGAERMRRHRANNGGGIVTSHVTSHVQKCNVLESESESESETESEKNKNCPAREAGRVVGEVRQPKSDPYADPTDRVLTYLNIRRQEILPKARGFDIRSKGNRRLPRARLASGHPEADLIAVIDSQIEAWRDRADMHVHFCPDTLFNETKFNKYLANIGVDGDSEAAERRKFLEMGDD